MKSLIMFLQCVLLDLGTWCHTSTTRDFKTITRRIEHEGISFLTISLPNFGKDFEKSLDQGFVGHDQFLGFSRTGGLPRLFGGFLDQVFDRSTGQLRDDPSVPAIHSIRQLTLMFGKINLPCSDARVAKALENYVTCEKEVRENDAKTSPDRLRRFIRIGSLLWGNVFTEVQRRIIAVPSEIIPKHGPGATADRIAGNRKWRQFEWTDRLEHVFPFGEHCVSSWRFYQESAQRVSYLEPGAERPVRVITVPKTLKTPRIIAIEPVCMQYMQQGLLDAFESAIAADDNAAAIVGWQSQVPNQHLARKGSRNGALATLDLKEASDRVSNQHVRLLLTNHRFLSEAVDSCRSRKADVHGFGVIRLAKFASMGSALCFPFEAMVFATIIFLAIEEELNRPVTRRDIKSMRGKVRVYGDDIIIPVEYVDSVIECLEDFGLRVNSGKSFWNGKFRESCGKEYYNGEDVSIVRVRSFLPTSLTDASEIVSTASLRNHCYKHGLWGAAAFLDEYMEKLIPWPVVGEQSPVLGRHSFIGEISNDKTDPHLQRPLVRGAMVRSLLPIDKLEGADALLKCLTLLEKSNANSLPSVGVNHLERSGRPLSVDIRIGYGPAW